MSNIGPPPSGARPSAAAWIPSALVATIAVAVAAVAGTCLVWVGFTSETSLALAIAAGLATATLGAAVVWTARRLLWACRWRLERAIVAAVERAIASAPRAGVADHGQMRRADRDADPSMATIAHSIASLRRDLAVFERAYVHAPREGTAGQGEGRRAADDFPHAIAKTAEAIASLRGDLAGVERRLGEGLSRARYEIEEGTAILVDLADRAERLSDPRSGG